MKMTRAAAAAAAVEEQQIIFLSGGRWSWEQQGAWLRKIRAMKWCSRQVC
jgi:hypothetical protein